MTLEEPEGPSRIRDNAIVRLAVYYTVVFGLFAGLLSVPGVGDLLSRERERHLGAIPQEASDLTADLPHSESVPTISMVPSRRSRRFCPPTRRSGA